MMLNSVYIYIYAWTMVNKQWLPIIGVEESVWIAGEMAIWKLHLPEVLKRNKRTSHNHQMISDEFFFPDTSTSVLSSTSPSCSAQNSDLREALRSASDSGQVHPGATELPGLRTLDPGETTTGRASHGPMASDGWMAGCYGGKMM